MDPVSGAVGLAASIYSLAGLAKDVYKLVKRLQLNEQCRNRLCKLLDDLINSLQSAGPRSETAAEKLVSSSLEEVKSTLESLLAGARNRRGLVGCVLRCIVASDVKAKLEEVERKLEVLRTEVVVVAGILQLKKQIPSISDAGMELPQSPVGLDRAQPILEFLHASKSEELRVIGIHGLPGVGKTTLLNYTWQEASLAPPFTARAYIQIGHDTTTQSLRALQSSMLQQLGGGVEEFSSIENGKKRLTDHFEQLRIDKMPVFLAIDNVFEVEDLKRLFPSKLSNNVLPAFSCIVVTCRNFEVIKALLNVCHLQKKNPSRVLCFAPPCLNLQESKAVFADCGGIHVNEHVELLDALVPLCEGLPLALTVLGNIFVDEGKRERTEWEGIRKQLQNLDEDNEETSLVTKALRLSYDKLKPTRRAAFLDVVTSFYGWPWETVERIVGVSVMEDLKSSSLILEADDATSCSHSTLRSGFDSFGRYWEGAPCVERVVTMHDLTLRFGESLCSSCRVTVRNFSSNRSFENLEAGGLRCLLWSRTEEADDSELEFLERATNLQVLSLHEDLDNYVWENLLEASYTHSDAAPSFSNGPQCLKYLRLDGWKSSRRIMEMKLSRGIREIHLHKCQDVIQLPDTPLQQLEWLRIYKCNNFEGFSSVCVEQWHNLKYLEVAGCDNITTVPAELGYLGNLRCVEFVSCQRFQDFPSLCNSSGPSHLAIKGCPSLQILPAMSCPLQILELGDYCLQQLPAMDLCKHLKRLPRAIGNSWSLQVSSVGGCESLEELPKDLGKLTTLIALDVSGCKSLKHLPPTIGNMLSLRTLSARECESLEELPDELGKLTSLTELDVSKCKSLKALPRAIANVSSLQTLRARGCESLEELPDELGKLIWLTELDVCWCKSLKRLPSTIESASSLQTLSVRGCESLEELPEELGKLTSLTALDVCWCESLKRLPPTFGNVWSLQTLSAQGCENLEELPEELGKLTSLIDIDVCGCESLKRLPQSICKASSLQRLRARGCESLEELPEELGKLTSLTSLDICECKSLKWLPSTIGDVSSLQRLRARGCESLKELPEKLGNLTSLIDLDVSWCKSLKRLPSTIGNTLSLQTLSARGCANLEELPEEMGRLTSLTTLDVCECKSLKQLPPTIGNALSLQTLRVGGCESLEELPEELGKLTSLIALDVSWCKSLKWLPSTIGNLLSLQSLSAWGCASLEELPEELGRLTSLTTLDVRECKSLKRLPPTIGNATSLQTLRVGGCESLEELPNELKKLTKLNIVWWLD